LGASVRGAHHARTSRPNQDAIAWRAPTDDQPWLVMAVADGHGAPRYLRSHRGAKLAVEFAVALAADFCALHAHPANLAALGDLAAEQLPRTLVRAWQDAARQELAAKPFTPEEEEAWQRHLGPRKSPVDPLRAYGATLLAALLAPQYAVFLQLGDGDIVIVDRDGGVTRPPLPTDPRLVANQTTSLCSPNAWKDVRVYFQPLIDRVPSLVMLATDGYKNSFADETGLHTAASDILAALRKRGPNHTQNRLTHWLHRTSAGGSGDDISVALAYHADAK
jgi:serine/threonine protein phosphatase PrpC